MENNIQQLPQITKRLDTYKMVIPEKVENKIRHICSKVWDTEWSGVLFYKPSGSFEDDTLTIRCEDILVMDIGNATYTEFDMSPDVISYMAENQELLDCQMGLIHSHNNMSTFFSGTDISTLKEEGRDRNHFVSLIVNNAGTYTAAITRKISYVEHRELSYSSFNNTKIVGAKETFEEANELEYFYLKIEFEGNVREDYTELDKRLADIKKSKEAKKSAISSFASTSPYSSLNPSNNKSKNSYYWGDYEDDYPSLFKDKVDTKKPEVTPKKEIKSSNLGDYFIEPTTRSKVTPKMIKDLTYQLLTGSITLTSSNDKFDINDWIKNHMLKTFDRRFNTSVSGLLNFKDWAMSMVEFMCMDTIETYDRDEDEIAFLIASGITAELRKFPANKYIDTLIEILADYELYI